MLKVIIFQHLQYKLFYNRIGKQRIIRARSKKLIFGPLFCSILM